MLPDICVDEFSCEIVRLFYEYSAKCTSKLKFDEIKEFINQCLNCESPSGNQISALYNSFKSFKSVTRQELSYFIANQLNEPFKLYVLKKFEQRHAEIITNFLMTNLVNSVQLMSGEEKKEHSVRKKQIIANTQKKPFKFTYQAKIKLSEIVDVDKIANVTSTTQIKPIPKSTYSEPQEIQNLKLKYHENNRKLQLLIEESNLQSPACAKIKERKNQDQTCENLNSNSPNDVFKIERCASPSYLNNLKEYKKNFSSVYRKVCTIQREEKMFLEKLKKLAAGEKSHDSHNRYVVKKYLECIEEQNRVLNEVRKLAKLRRKKIRQKQQKQVDENRNKAQNMIQNLQNLKQLKKQEWDQEMEVKRQKAQISKDNHASVIEVSKQLVEQKTKNAIEDKESRKQIYENSKSKLESNLNKQRAEIKRKHDSRVENLLNREQFIRVPEENKWKLLCERNTQQMAEEVKGMRKLKLEEKCRKSKENRDRIDLKRQSVEMLDMLYSNVHL